MEAPLPSVSHGRLTAPRVVLASQGRLAARGGVAAPSAQGLQGLRPEGERGAALRLAGPVLVGLTAGCRRRQRRRRGSQKRPERGGLAASGSSSSALSYKQPAALTSQGIADFWKCRRRFGFGHLPQDASVHEDPLEDPAPLAQQLLRRVLARLLKLPAGERTLERADGLVGQAIRELRPDRRLLRRDVRDFLALVMQGLDNYFKLEDPAEVAPLQVDYRLCAPLEGSAVSKMETLLDRLDVDLNAKGDCVVTIVRYSLSGPKPSVEDLHQLKLQAWMFHASGTFTSSKLKCRLLCLGGEGSEQVLTYSSSDMDAVKREVGAVHEELQNLEADTQDSSLEAKVSPSCWSCGFRSRCTAFQIAPPSKPAPLVVEDMLEQVSARNAEATREAEAGAEEASTKEDARASTEGVTVVSTPEEAEKVLRTLMSLREEGRFHAVDTETMDWSPGKPMYGNGKIICFSIYCGDDVNFGSGPRLWVDNMDADGNLTGVLECFREYFEDPGLKKVFHNYSFDRAMFHNAGITVAGFAGDTMHMGRLEHSDRFGYSLSALGAELVGIDWGKQSLSDLMKAEGVQRAEQLHLSPRAETREAWVEYSTFDTVATWKLHERLSQLLSDRPWHPPDEEEPVGTLLDFYNKYWGPFGEVLATMEGRGVPFDADLIQEQLARAEEDLDKQSTAFRDWVKSEYRKRYAGEEAERLVQDADKINLSSPVQMRQLLFGSSPKQASGSWIGCLGLDPQIVTARTPTGQVALGAAVYEELAGKDPANGKFGIAYDVLGEEGCKGLSHKCTISRIEKAVSSFLSKLPQWASATGRLHTSFNLNTATGRLSSSNPNLQQLPALDKDSYGVRSAVRCDDSRRFIVADYGQLDIRVLAHISKCRPMIDALRSGIDFHSGTALNMYSHVREAVEQGKVALEKPLDGECSVPLVKDVFATERRHAKAVNFGIAYGLTSYGLAGQLSCTQEEAEQMIAKWYKAYPEVKQWQERIVAEAKKQTMPSVVSLRGRQRIIENLKFYEDNSKSRYGQRKSWKEALERPSFEESRLGYGAQRQAINAPVQGGSADVVVEAMLKAHASQELRDLGFSMVLQIHDELVFEGPEENSERALALVREIMEQPFLDGFELEVPLPVDAQITKTWAEAKG